MALNTSSPNRSTRCIPGVLRKIRRVFQFYVPFNFHLMKCLSSIVIIPIAVMTLTHVHFILPLAKNI